MIRAVRTCVIFNPTAKGDKARKFRERLDVFGGSCAFKQTRSAGEARALAAEAVAEGFEVIAAAGGDGTLNEVLNGIADAPGGLDRARLGVLPLGTVNVFAKELGLPVDLEAAWKTLQQGRETRIDLCAVDYHRDGVEKRHYFAQMAGAGLDARAIELTDWSLKKKIGPLAYVWAGFKAMTEPAPRIHAQAGKESLHGALVLIGNGRYYGGKFKVFSGASLRDGKMVVRVFPKVGFMALPKCLGMFVAGGDLPESVARRLHVENLTLTSESPVSFEVDGELCGSLPAKFSIERERLRVIAP